MWLPRSVINAVDAAVDEVFYVSYQTTRVFNESRAKGTPLVFSGWYWAKGRREGGPFKSQSSAYRDAWYALVAIARPPAIHTEAKGEIKRQERAARRERLGLRRVA
jgi:hypothetical protein